LFCLEELFIPEILVDLTSESIIREIAQLVCVHDLYLSLSPGAQLWFTCAHGIVEDRCLVQRLWRAEDTGDVDAVCQVLRSWNFASRKRKPKHKAGVGHSRPLISTAHPGELHDIARFAAEWTPYDTFLEKFEVAASSKKVAKSHSGVSMTLVPTRLVEADVLLHRLHSALRVTTRVGTPHGTTPSGISPLVQPLDNFPSAPSPLPHRIASSDIHERVDKLQEAWRSVKSLLSALDGAIQNAEVTLSNEAYVAQFTTHVENLTRESVAPRAVPHAAQQVVTSDLNTCFQQVCSAISSSVPHLYAGAESLTAALLLRLRRDSVDATLCTASRRFFRHLMASLEKLSAVKSRLQNAEITKTEASRQLRGPVAQAIHDTLTTFFYLFLFEESFLLSALNLASTNRSNTNGTPPLHKESVVAHLLCHAKYLDIMSVLEEQLRGNRMSLWADYVEAMISFLRVHTRAADWPIIGHIRDLYGDVNDDNSADARWEREGSYWHLDSAPQLSLPQSGALASTGKGWRPRPRGPRPPSAEV
jgi:hypothetical protein